MVSAHQSRFYWLTLVVIANIFLLEIVIRPPLSQATIAQCKGNFFSPAYIEPSTTQTVTLYVENNGPDDANWIRITRPSTNFSFTDAQTDDWETSVTNSSIVLTGNSLSGGTEMGVEITLTTGNSETSNQLFTVEMSDFESEDEAITCTSTAGIEITNDPPATLEILNVTVSNVAHNSVTISFTTSNPATSELSFSASGDDEGVQEITTETSSHSYTLTGLSTNTTYTYTISVDDGDSTLDSDEYTFTTALSSAATSTPGPTSTPIVQTNTITLPTPTPLPDTKAPVVTLDKPLVRPYKDPPTITGSAVDNTAIATIEFTTDNGQTWTRVTSINGLSSSTATFSFTPSIGNDGTISLRARARDNAGNIGQSSNVSFIVDRTGPDISLSTNLSRPFTTSPTIEGVANDPSGESRIEYSIDAGSNWKPVDQTTIRNAQQTSFKFTLPPLDDGNYDLHIRAYDQLGNTTLNTNNTVIIDRLPPRIGATMLFIGPQLLSPSAQGTIATVTRVEHKLVTSIIGGPTQVVATLKNIVSAEETPFALNRLTGTNIWITNITLPQSGTFTVTITAIDGAQNYTSAVVSTLQAATAFPLQDTTGKSLDGTISIYAQDTETGNFLPWDSNPFGQRNPVTVKNDESFTAVLPGGTYYLEVKAPGYRTIQTHKFTLSQPTALTPSFVVTSVPSIRLFGIRISLPSLTREYITLPSVDSPTLEESHSEPLPFPTITLRNAELELSPDTLESATTLVTFLNTWSVQTPSQLNELTRFMEQHPDVSIMVVVPHETASAVELFLKRGNYSLPMIADPDGELADALDYHTVPTHFVVDRSATIVAQHHGFRSAAQLTIDQQQSQNAILE